MASVIEFPYKVLKRMLVYDDGVENKGDRHKGSFCQALTCDELNVPSAPNQESCSPEETVHSTSVTQCPPTTIVTREGVRIPPATSDWESEQWSDPMSNHGTQTTPRATRHVDYPLPAHRNNNNSLVSKMVQVPSERCLLSPLGTVSDSFLPDKVIRIREKIRYQRHRYMKRQREKIERDRQRQQLLRHCTTSNSYQTISSSTHASDHMTSSACHHPVTGKVRGRRQLASLLRSGRQLKQERPRKVCNCCCCSRHFCHHKTEYTRNSRNPSCESFVSSRK